MSISSLGWLKALEGTEDDFDFDDSYAPTIGVRCKYCGAEGLFWAQTKDGKWRLQFTPGPTEVQTARHFCASPAVTLSLNGVALPTHSPTQSPTSRRTTRRLG